MAINITSDAFTAHGAIPKKYTGKVPMSHRRSPGAACPRVPKNWR